MQGKRHRQQSMVFAFVRLYSCKLKRSLLISSPQTRLENLQSTAAAKEAYLLHQSLHLQNIEINTDKYIENGDC